MNGEVPALMEPLDRVSEPRLRREAGRWVGVFRCGDRLAWTGRGARGRGLGSGSGRGGDGVRRGDRCGDERGDGARGVHSRRSCIAGRWCGGRHGGGHGGPRGGGSGGGGRGVWLLLRLRLAACRQLDRLCRHGGPRAERPRRRRRRRRGACVRLLEHLPLSAPCTGAGRCVAWRVRAMRMG
eukprot:7390207-Prymnesium_polylepis.3